MPHIVRVTGLRVLPIEFGCRELRLGWMRLRSYTLSMDSVRFGRALGIGTRLAAKTVASAVDAAMAPNPSAAPKAGDEGIAKTAAVVTEARVAEKVVQNRAQAVQAGRGLQEGGRRFKEAAWSPFVRLSGVLWLELVGVFFGLFAVSAGVGAWRLRNGLHGMVSDTAHQRFLIAVGVAVVFGYFSVSSFVRAGRRERQR
jgi:hypothetical protein